MARRYQTRRRSSSAVRGGRTYGGYSRPARRGAAVSKRRSSGRVGARASKRVTARRAPAQVVRIEMVYRDASPVARPQGTVELKKGAKPKL